MGSESIAINFLLGNNKFESFDIIDTEDTRGGSGAARAAA
jgi:hypothetical protein